MRYREVPPHPSIARWVRCLWILEGPACPGAPVERVLPDGCPELVLHWADPFRRRSWDERRPATQHRAAVVGQLERWIDLRPTGRVGILGVRFRPAGLAAFTGDEARRFTGTSVALEDLGGGPGRFLLERVAEAATDGERIAVVTEALRRRLERRSGVATPTERAVDLLERSGGRLSIGRVADAVGVGRRRLERGFAADVGVAPKRLARIFRFQAALQRLEVVGPLPAALDAGYGDEAHLHRDFRDFAGLPPGRWLAGEHALEHLFLG